MLNNNKNNLFQKHSIIFVLNAIKKANDEMMFVRLAIDKRQQRWWLKMEAKREMFMAVRQCYNENQKYDKDNS